MMWKFKFGMCCWLVFFACVSGWAQVSPSSLDTATTELDNSIKQLENIEQELMSYNQQILDLKLKISALETAGTAFTQELETQQALLKDYQDKVQALLKNYAGLLRLCERYRSAYMNYKLWSEIEGAILIGVGVVVVGVVIGYLATTNHWFGIGSTAAPAFGIGLSLTFGPQGVQLKTAW
jgi:uncharacterized membrane protein (DUF485 family)